MSARRAPGLRPLLAVTLAVAALVLLPVLFAFLAPPALGGDGGPALSAASRDLSTAALDRLERLLSGDLTVQLAGLRPAGRAAVGACRGDVAEAAPASRLERRVRPCETERVL